MEPFRSREVEAVFNGYPDELRQKLLHLRQLVFETASETEGVGPLEETLKWGHPSYLTPETRSGTTVRISQIDADTERYGMFVHCQTTLIPTFREMFPDVLNFDGTRAIEFDLEEDPPEDILRQCISLALTYHLDKKKNRRVS